MSGEEINDAHPNERASMRLEDGITKKIGNNEYLINQLVNEISNEQLRRLKDLFLSKSNGMHFEEFVGVWRDAVSIPDGREEKKRYLNKLADLFHQLDSDADGKIDWVDFSDTLVDTMAFTKQIVQTYQDIPLAPRKYIESDIQKVVYLREIEKFVACRQDNTAVIHSTDDGKVVQVLHGHKAPVVNALFVPDYGLVTSSADRTMILWDKIALEKRKQIPTGSPQMCMRYYSDFKRLYSGGTDGNIYSWDMDSLTRGNVTMRGHEDWVMDLLQIPELGLLMTASLDKVIKTWDLQTGAFKSNKLGHTKGILSLAYNKDYRLLLSAGYDREIFVWNPFTPNVVQKMRGHDKPLVGVYSYNDSPEIISVDMGGKIMIWDIRTFGCIQTLGGYSSKFETGSIAAFCADDRERQIITIGKRLCLWKAKDNSSLGRIKHRIFTIVYNSVYKLLLTPCGKDVTIWKAASGELQTYYKVFDCDITALTIANQQRDIVAGSIEGKLKVLSLLNGSTIFEMDVGADEIRAIFTIERLKKDKVETAQHQEVLKQILVVSTTGHATIIDYDKIGKDRIPVKFRCTLHNVHCCDYSKENTFFIACEKNVAEVWYVQTGTVKIKFRSEGNFTAVKFIDSLNCLATADDTHTITLWNIPGFAKISTISIDARFTVRSLDYCINHNRLIVANNEQVLQYNMKTVLDNFWQLYSCQVTEGVMLFKGRYALEGIVQGGLNAVSLGVDIKMKRRVALKKTTDVGEFYTEVRVMKEVKSNFIVAMYDYYEPVTEGGEGGDSAETQKELDQDDGSDEDEDDDGSNEDEDDDSGPECIIAFECGDKSLYDFIRAKPIKPNDIRWIVECMARGLKDLHDNGFISADFKSKNVMLFGETWKIIDLDNSRKFGEDMPLKYTPNYCPPEMAKIRMLKNMRRQNSYAAGGEHKKITLKATASYDMWGFGVIICELHTQQPLFAHMDESMILRELTNENEVELPLASINDPVLRTIVQNVVVKDPNKRWTVKQVLDYMDNAGYLIGEKHSAVNSFKPFPRIAPSAQFTPPSYLHTDLKATDKPINVTKRSSMTCITVTQSPCAIVCGDFYDGEGRLILYSMSGDYLGRLPFDNIYYDEWRFPASTSDYFKKIKNVALLASKHWRSTNKQSTQEGTDNANNNNNNNVTSPTNNGATSPTSPIKSTPAKKKVGFSVPHDEATTAEDESRPQTADANIDSTPTSAHDYYEVESASSTAREAPSEQVDAVLVVGLDEDVGAKERPLAADGPDEMNKEAIIDRAKKFADKLCPFFTDVRKVTQQTEQGMQEKKDNTIMKDFSRIKSSLNRRFYLKEKQQDRKQKIEETYLQEKRGQHDLPLEFLLSSPREYFSQEADQIHHYPQNYSTTASSSNNNNNDSSSVKKKSPISPLAASIADFRPKLDRNLWSVPVYFRPESPNNSSPPRRGGGGSRSLTSSPFPTRSLSPVSALSPLPDHPPLYSRNESPYTFRKLLPEWALTNNNNNSSSSSTSPSNGSPVTLPPPSPPPASASAAASPSASVAVSVKSPQKSFTNKVGTFLDFRQAEQQQQQQKPRNDPNDHKRARSKSSLSSRKKMNLYIKTRSSFVGGSPAKQQVQQQQQQQQQQLPRNASLSVMDNQQHATAVHAESDHHGGEVTATTVSSSSSSSVKLPPIHVIKEA